MAVDNGFDREVVAWLAFASTQTSLRVWLTAANDTLFQAALSHLPRRPNASWFSALARTCFAKG